MDKQILSAQRQQWQVSFLEMPEMFGTDASTPALKAVELFKREDKTTIIELGSGQGRDTIHFARNGLKVCALDYSDRGLEVINEKAKKLRLSHLITTTVHDVRTPLPFADETFDACYSHMLFCMALTNAELEFIIKEIRRVLNPGGINIYTVRHVGDPHYGTGINRGEDMYEVNGFIVHFFSMEKVDALAKGYKLVSVDKFEEGSLPRKLFSVTLRKA